MSGCTTSSQDVQTPCDEIEVPEDPCDDDDDDQRLWIGNLGTEITEYSVLKLVQKFGALRKMNFIYHKLGPDKGKPKGYCFVSFHTWEAAERARRMLDGKVIFSRRLFVKWANKLNKDEIVVNKSKVKSKSSFSSEVMSERQAAAAASPPAAVVAALSASSAVSAASAEAKIQAIEAKLKMMEQTQKDFSLSTSIQPPAGLAVLSSRQTCTQSGRHLPYRRAHRPRR